MTTTPATPATVTRRREAEQMGDFAGREYQNLIEDHTWDRDNWARLLRQIRENPYAVDHPEIPLPEEERLDLHKRWAQHFWTGRNAQQAENRRAQP